MLNPKDQLELVQLEEAMWQEATRFDLAFQEARFADDFVEFGRSGRIYNREQIIQTDYHRIEAKLPLPDLQIAELDENCVLITYNSEASYDNVMEYARRSSIWSRTPTGWKMRFHQGTPYTPE